MKLEPLELKPEDLTLIDSGAISELAAKYEASDCVYMLESGSKRYTGITYWRNRNGTDCFYALLSKRKDGLQAQRKLPHYTEVYVFKSKS